MTKTILLIALTVLLASCGKGLTIRKSNIADFDNHFSAKVANHSTKVKGQGYRDLALLDLFEIRNIKTDSVLIKLSDKGVLQITYKDSLETKELLFNGRFVKRRYLEIYIRNKKREIPPLIPIIYSTRDVYRLRLAMTTDGELLVDNQWDQSGNVFILGGGSSGRRQGFFKARTLK